MTERCVNIKHDSGNWIVELDELKFCETTTSKQAFKVAADLAREHKLAVVIRTNGEHDGIFSQAKAERNS